MSAASVWVVRHGETEWSVTGQHTSRTDLPLTAAGEHEAHALAPVLAGMAFATVRSSPMQRSVRTAELAGFTPTMDTDLEEWDYGELEGLTTDQIRASYPGWTIWDGPWPNGEQPADVAVRADRVVKRVLDLPPGAAALLFAHGHILRALAARWLRRPVSDGRLLALGTATVGVLAWEHDAPVVDHWNVPPAFPAPNQG